MKCVVVTGIPGVGKTTVLNQALEKLGEKFEIINFGDKMFEVASKENLVASRDEMRRLPPEVQKRIQKLAAIAIAKRAEVMNVVVDTHCTVKTPAGFLPGLPRWVLEELKPTQIVLVEALPEEIRRRRESDTTRTRDEDSLEQIALHQEMNRAAAMAYAMLTGATVLIVENHDNRLEEAVEQLVKAM
ncbi:adenylate kinase [Candidatus Pyrohabitans sp.]